MTKQTQQKLMILKQNLKNKDAEDMRICAGCDKIFIPTLSKRLCRDCKIEVENAFRLEQMPPM